MLESLLASVFDAPAAEQAARLDAVCRAHPEHADVLRTGVAAAERMLGTIAPGRTAAVGATRPCGVDAEHGDAWASELLAELQRRGPDRERYEHGAEVARGGMGRIVRVEDRNLRRQLAMKRRLAGPAETSRSDADRKLRARFLEEAQVTGQLDHPGVVPVHDVGLDADGGLFFTMKLVKGRSLREVFEHARAGTEGWTTAAALRVLLKVCEAMAYAHDKGVIHRDLKPSNVMVGRFGEVYVMDWGLARVIGRDDGKDIRIRDDASATVSRVRTDRRSRDPDSPLLTMDGDVVGTPAYMPPEQARGELERIAPASDVYAVGAMLYELLAGHMPYVPPGSKLSSWAVWGLVQAGPPQPLTERAPGAPAELVAITDKAMAREPDDRYGEIQELAADLARFLDGRVVPAYERGALAELRKWIGRNRGLAAAAAIAALSLLAGLAASLLLWSDATATGTRLEQRNAEFDLVGGMVRLERARESERALYPAWPENGAAIERWLGEDTARVLALVPELRATLRELRQRALPATAAQLQADREKHPRYPELERLRRERAALRLANDVRAGVRAPVVPSGFDPQVDGIGAAEIVRMVYERIGSAPDSAGRFGREEEALALARLAASNPHDSPAVRAFDHDALAMASFRVGLDREAVEAARVAASVAPEPARAAYTRRLRELEASVATARADTERRIAELDARIARLEDIVSERPALRFDDDADAFLHDALSELASEMREFEAGPVARARQRLRWARRVGELSIERYRDRWRRAREALARADDVVASARYREVAIDLAPQPGLVPIGMNPTTKLWEFYHLRSAWDPRSDADPAAIAIPRHAADGRIEVSAATGVVFVLVPGGELRIGAQADDPASPNHDPGATAHEGPVHAIALRPYFLARHELTRAQWERLSGAPDPSELPVGYLRFYMTAAIDRRHPVTSVSWTRVDAVLRAHGLTLPTEAQWERACRAGTDTPWSTGATPSSLARSANVADVRHAAIYERPPEPYETFDDGFQLSAPVGTFLANAFGMHDMHGNVAEMCLDWYNPYMFPAEGPDGLRYAQESARRVARGGSYASWASRVRAAFRSQVTPGDTVTWAGVRPARELRAAR